MVPSSKAKREAPIKFPASIGGMKTLANGMINITFSAGPNELLKIMNLLNIKQDGDSVLLTARRVKTPKVKKPDAPKKQDVQTKKPKRRVRRYPYRD